jgi:hypothetical protein
VRSSLRRAEKIRLVLLVALLGFLFSVLMPLIALVFFVILLFPLFPFVLFFPRRLAWMLVRSVSVTFRTALRPVPALLAILVIMFTTSDAWRMFGVMTALRFVAFIALIMVLSLAAIYLAMRAPDASWRTIIRSTGSREELLRVWAEGTPAKELIRMGVTPILPVSDSVPTEGEDADTELHPVAFNIRLIYAATVLIHMVATALWLSLTFMLMGFIVVSKQLTIDMLHGSPTILLQLKLFDQEFILTRQLVVLSITLGCIAALTYAAGTLQSTEGRAAFIEYATLDLRRGIGALSYYIGILMALILTLRDMGTLNRVSVAISELVTKLLETLERLRSTKTDTEAADAP